MENGENRVIRFLTKWLEICVIFFRDGVEEMKKNKNCFVIWIHVDNMLHFLKEVNKSNHVLV